jgi:glucose-1-phosphate adenylyltransferase
MGGASAPSYVGRELAAEEDSMHPLGRETVAVVLAGGRGTRLGALTRHRCKPALPFGGRCRSIDFTLSNCVNSGVRQIGVATQYRPQSLIGHLGRSWTFLDRRSGEFIEVWPAEASPRSAYGGTADAVYQNLANIDRYRPRYVLVLAADHVYRMHYGKLLEFHREQGAGVTVACQPVPAEQARHFGIMSVEDDVIVSFEEKPQRVPAGPEALASMGIYVFDAELLRTLLVNDAGSDASQHDFGCDIVPRCVRAADIRVCAHRLRDPCTGGSGYWRDIGTIDAYWSANMDLLAPGCGLDLHDPQWPIPSARVPAAARPVGHEETGPVQRSILGRGCRVAGAVVRRSILGDDVHVSPGSVVEDSILLPGVRVGRGCRLRRTIVEEGLVLPDGTWSDDGTVPDEALCETSEAGITVLHGFAEEAGRVCHAAAPDRGRQARSAPAALGP